jgi:hypothetical protein
MMAGAGSTRNSLSIGVDRTVERGWAPAPASLRDRRSFGRIASTCRRRRGNEMRMFVAFLIVLSVLYFWDVEYNNGTLSDGLRKMGRSMSHNMVR